jgi:DNA-directed RNA polymerase subunit RPC12/RpoP
MNFWVPLVLEQGLDPVYSECRCPKCGFESVHHMGVPCQHYSCPRCGEKMERLEEPKVGEGVVTKTKAGTFKLPDGSGFFVGTIKTKKSKK